MQKQANTVSTVEALAAVRRLSFAVLEAAEAPVIYRALASELFAVSGVDQVQVARVSQDHTVGRGNCYRMGDGGAPEMGSEYLHHFDETSATRLVMESGEPFNAPDVRSSPAIDQRLAERFNASSALFVPVGFGGDVRAVVGLISETPRVFDDGEVELGLHAGQPGVRGPCRTRDERPSQRPRRAADSAGAGGPDAQRPA